MDKSFLDITGFADVFSRFWRQKNPARLRRFAKKSDPFRKPASGFSCPKGCEGRYCMQSIPLAVLKPRRPCALSTPRNDCMQSIPLAVLKQNGDAQRNAGALLHAIHTACGIETIFSLPIQKIPLNCMQSIPLAVLKPLFRASFTSVLDCMQSIPLAVLKPLLSKTKNSIYYYCMQSIPLAVLKKDRFVQKIPKSMKRSPAAEPQGFFCYGS